MCVGGGGGVQVVEPCESSASMHVEIMCLFFFFVAVVVNFTHNQT